MKKALLFITLIAAVMLQSCGDDDDRNTNDAINTSYVKYSFEANNTFYDFYDVRIVYNLLDGNEVTVLSNDADWSYKWEVKDSRKGDMATIPVGCKIVATQKTDLPSIDTSVERYDFECDYGIFWYSKTVTAKSKRENVRKNISKEQIAEWLKDNKEWTIVDYSNSPLP